VKISDLFEDEEQPAKEDKSLRATIKHAGFSTDTSFERRNGKKYKVKEYSKEVTIEPYNLVLKYTVNPDTESWNYVIVNSDTGKTIDVAGGEDETSMIKSIKKKKKILPSWIEEYLD
jgi:hypothetical protein